MDAAHALADNPGAEQLPQYKQDRRSVAFVSGNFNIIHPGHLRLLRFATENADVLVVGVTPDGTRGVTVPEALRAEALKSIAFIDHVVLLREPAESFIAKLQPDIVVKGKEFEDRANPEQRVVDDYGGKLLFGSGEVSFSSINLLQREYFETDYSSIRPPTDFPRRHAFSAGDVRTALNKLAGLRVVVVGDLIVDNYITCDPLGMSQEDPTIVVTPIEEKMFVGGAGIVSAHARGLGGDVRFVTVTGRDKNADFARTELARYGVEADFLEDSTRPTTFKQRYRAHGKTLLRVNHLRQHAVDHDLADAIVAHVGSHLRHADVLLFSDFNYGCLPQNVVERLIDLARARGVMLAADSQASSQIADISRFRDADLITPTEREARLALGDFESGLAVIAEKLQAKARTQNVFITLGAEGLLCYAPRDGEYMTDRLPAFNPAPKDVAGAGDSLFTAVALALRAGVDVWQAAYLGALAAGCQVSRVGNTPLTLRELAIELDGGQF
ncbi:MAG: PfkB family carbohydrate kinase [Hyphomonadaceae bacterium]